MILQERVSRINLSVNTPLSHRPTRGPKFAWGRASPGPFCVGRAGGRHLRGDCVGTARLQREFVPSVDMAKCVGIETGYIKIKMRGDYKYTSKWVGIAWGLRGDEKIIYTLCGAGVGLPTQGFVEWGAPHTIPTQGFPSGDCVGRICVGE